MLHDFPPSSDWLDELDAPVCPYTGLRTFTEEEAVYFRGREAHIGRCVELLADQHFVMITGASGDGKSSLVYAGLLPEIRAGFFRAKYSNWTVCTFRPERQPLRQMARAVAASLRLTASSEAIESELAQGFSALVELYQNSSLVPLVPLPEQPEPTEAERRRQRNESANLLIVVDQFEEFFTNAENYDGEVPAASAQAVINLLLETTRLAREQNLPIYIICTMRSDYIGQCADFRGLVELIGESQYFVPRLLRAEFVEIIREPAQLSGNRIAERLVQRLVDDNRDGRDQLPVLQHALYRIWVAAQCGREEMDLVHYAMVGGLPPVELPWADQRRFADWRHTLSYEQEQRLLANPSLHNVLDAHADELYATAAETFNQHFAPALPAVTAERLVELTFRGLTKVDGGRVVRNRLTGAEITALVDDPALPWQVVCRLLRPFRQPGNTFLSPFLDPNDPGTDDLPPETVLDITHESLIRNWQRLARWAQEEAEDVRTVGQLTTQAASWAAHAEDKGYLLPIGPYSQFAKWFARKKPNSSWLAYYVADAGHGNQRMAQAEAQSKMLRHYLQRSKERLRFSLLIAKYGVGRLAGWVLTPLLLLVLIWGGWTLRKHNDDYVAYTVLRDRKPFLKSSYVSISDKADFIISAQRLKDFAYQPPFSGLDSTEYHFSTLLDALENDTLALDCELLLYQKCNNVGYDSIVGENRVARQVLFDLDKRLDQAGSILLPAADGPTPSAKQRQLATRTAQTVMALTHYMLYTAPRPLLPGRPRCLAHLDNAPLLAIKQKLLLRLREYLQREVEATSGRPPRAVDFWFWTQVLLGQGDFSAAQLGFLKKLSPLKQGGSSQFARFYPALNQAALFEEGPTLRGIGYQTYMLAAAALQEPAQLVACADSLSKYTRECADMNKLGPVLPYLLKYPGSLPAAYAIIRRSQVAPTTAFAILTYSLLSVAPDNLALGLPEPGTESASAATSANIYADRVSYSIPLRTRDNCWPVLASLIPPMAQREKLFEMGNGEQIDEHENGLFLEAFYLKHKGNYLYEIRSAPQAGGKCFSQFDAALEQLRATRRRPHAVSMVEWNTEATETYTTGKPIDALDFLLHTGRPVTLNWNGNTGHGNFFLPPFFHFYRHRLNTLTAAAVPARRQVEWLDSMVFLESALPGRYVLPRAASLYRDKFGRPVLPLADVRWVKDLRIVKAGGARRRARNLFLTRVLSSCQDFTAISGLNVSTEVTPFARTLAEQPGFAQAPLQAVLSDLAAAMAAHGRVADAFAVANLLPNSTIRTATKIRAGEQAMLNDANGNLDALDEFLHQYAPNIEQHPDLVPASMIQVLTWRNQSEFDDLAELLVKEGSANALRTGLGAVCLGQTLAGKSYDAVKTVPAYVSETQRQRDFNRILAGIAHANRLGRRDGWQEYDEATLTTPNDYLGGSK
ncbi:nSTAND1 domain-containing NTPase [Hymenobacter properus]|uniref:ATP-binding protein n=1 Tax=Hymenobacter properus TaxID=2791026 RepID=A0A931FKD9_9BACT|nr:ATP-binding protein [Hymenobacter properus]MBF9140896.1 ATP-binding protein [Hymenobacter properus]MBR7719705.1 ATP-binding protein [Microvirga sp. SRT04]